MLFQPSEEKHGIMQYDDWGAFTVFLFPTH
jgi:hypothetical protein